jgi:hypothetical protein
MKSKKNILFLFILLLSHQSLGYNLAPEGEESDLNTERREAYLSSLSHEIVHEFDSEASLCMIEYIIARPTEEIFNLEVEMHYKNNNNALIPIGDFLDNEIDAFQLTISLSISEIASMEVFSTSIAQDVLSYLMPLEISYLSESYPLETINIQITITEPLNIESSTSLSSTRLEEDICSDPCEIESDLENTLTLCLNREDCTESESSFQFGDSIYILHSLVNENDRNSYRLEPHAFRISINQRYYDFTQYVQTFCEDDAGQCLGSVMFKVPMGVVSRRVTLEIATRIYLNGRALEEDITALATSLEINVVDREDQEELGFPWVLCSIIGSLLVLVPSVLFGIFRCKLKPEVFDHQIQITEEVSPSKKILKRGLTA